MKTLLMTSESIFSLEAMLNSFFYSSTYKIIDGKIMYGNPLKENTLFKYSKKGNKHQIHYK